MQACLKRDRDENWKAFARYNVLVFTLQGSPKSACPTLAIWIPAAWWHRIIYVDFKFEYRPNVLFSFSFNSMDHPYNGICLDIEDTCWIQGTITETSHWLLLWYVLQPWKIPLAMISPMLAHQPAAAISHKKICVTNKLITIIKH